MTVSDASRSLSVRMRTSYWRAAEPKPSYQVVIVGGGGHGLATAYYLAKNHGITDVCVVEKGWLAGGNMARNTTIIRSNYLWDESVGIYEHSLKLWEGLEQELGFDVEFSQRGVLNLAHTMIVNVQNKNSHVAQFDSSNAKVFEVSDSQTYYDTSRLKRGN